MSEEQCRGLLSVSSSGSGSGREEEEEETRRDDVPDGVDQPPAGTKSGGLIIMGDRITPRQLTRYIDTMEYYRLVLRYCIPY